VERVLAIGSVLVVSAVFLSKISARFGVPSLLLFLGLGMVAGSDGLGGIWFDNAELAQATGTVALTFILFGGGLDTDWKAIRPVLWRGLSLATVGAAVTAGLVGWFTHWLLGLGLMEGLLVGAIVCSTDAAAVFAVLRTQRMTLKARLQPLLELESGTNDPMAVFLTVGLIQLIATPSLGPGSLVPIFLTQMIVGLLGGLAFGFVAVRMLNRIDLEIEGLYPVLLMGIVLVSYSVTAILGGSGFLATYIVGLVMGNNHVLHKGTLVRFTDGLTWLMQIAMFLILGLLVFPSRLPAVAGSGTAIALFLVFVARPASVFIALLFARLGTRHKLLVSWVGLRGAVPIVLATFPLLAGFPRADLYFHLVFFVVISSLLLQGTTIGWVARRLALAGAALRRGPSALEFAPAHPGSNQLLDLVVEPSSPVISLRLVDLGLPPSALIVLITRGKEYVIPRGSTALQSGDQLLVLADTPDAERIRERIEGTKSVEVEDA
jgi:potassium/hydrogen antiporter